MPPTLWLLCLCAYLLGAVPFGIFVTKLFAGRDVREVGSGNIGATNVARAAGKVAAVLTLVLDAAKAMLPAYLGLRFFGAVGGALAGGSAFVGHVFPAYLKFRGGKGVATGLGVFLVLAPVAALVGLLVYGVILAITRVSAVGSLAALLALGVTVALTSATSILWLYSFIATVVVFRHKANVQALMTRRTKP